MLPITYTNLTLPPDLRGLATTASTYTTTIDLTSTMTSALTWPYPAFEPDPHEAGSRRFVWPVMPWTIDAPRPRLPRVPTPRIFRVQSRG